MSEREKRETAFKKAYDALNTAQKQAVDAVEGPVMVVAGPGTGKTQILTLRIANILQQTDAAPENILALTFTNSGVHAMRTRLIEIIGDDAYRVGIFTFHSFAEHVIREFSFFFPDLEFAQVVTDLEKIRILENIITAGEYREIVSRHDLFSSLGQVKKAIDDIKQEGYSPEAFLELLPAWEKELLADENVYYKRKFGKYNAGDMKPAEKQKIDTKLAKAREVGEAFARYQEVLREKSRYDFTDMIIRVLRELAENESLKLDLQETYQYVLVDEHQDTNEGQNRLIELLTDAEHLDGRPNLFTVGDEKQSIYRFQGASAETFAHLRSHYRDVRVIELTENYRSTRDILDTAHSLIVETLPEAQALNSQEAESTPVRVCEFSNYKYELLYVAEDIKTKLENGTDPSEVAVIYRSNRHIEEVKEVFAQKNIPFTVLSKNSLFADRAIDNLVTLLKAIEDPYSDHYLGKALFIDFLGFDAFASVDRLRAFNHRKRTDGADLLTVLREDAAYAPFVDLLEKLKEREANVSFSVFFKEFLNDSGYLAHMLGQPDSREQLQKIDTLFDEVKRQMAATRGYRLTDFIASVDAYQKYGIDIEASGVQTVDGVMCMTAHRSKGLEFEHVYLINSTRSNWEKSRGFPGITLPIKDYKGAVDDERRLFYVAMTRAKYTLTITSSLTDWEGKEREKSQFVTELDPDHVAVFDTEPFEHEHTDALSSFLRHTGIERSILDPDYLKQLFLEGSLSVTALTNYRECAMQYLFRSLIRLPSEYTPALLYGDLVHKALEHFFDACKREKQILPKTALLTQFRDAMSHSFMYDDTYDRYLARGEEALGGYYNAYHKHWSTRVENELNVRRLFTLANGEEISLTGKIDKVEYLDAEIEGRIRIIDYKTGKAYSDKSRKREKEDLDRQIVFYHLLMEEYKDGRYTVEEAVLDFIEKNKKGELEQKTFAVTKEDIDRVKDEINEMAAAVMDGTFLSQGCGERDCEYCLLRNEIERG